MRNKKGDSKVLIQILVVAVVLVAGFFIYSVNGIVKDEGFNYDGEIGIVENLKKLGGDSNVDGVETVSSGSSGAGSGRSSGGGGGGGGGAAGGGGGGSGGGSESGGSVTSSVGTSVSREVVGNFVSGEETEIILHIISDEKAIGIREGDIDDWNILDSDLSEDFEIFEFKGSSNEWVIADPGKEVRVDLTYTVVSSPGTDSVQGKYFTSDGDQIFEGEIDGDLGQTHLSPISEGQGTIWIIGVVLLVLIVALIVVIVKRRK
jgi:hypothetical protein